jgi:hypothetical protein
LRVAIISPMWLVACPITNQRSPETRGRSLGELDAGD